MKRFIDTFSDANMAIDPKFKSKLRGQVMQAARKGGQASGRQRSRLWPKLLLVPALAAVVVVALVSLNLTKPGNLKQPLTTQKVSAAELLRRSSESESKSRPDTFSYVESHSEMRRGPRSYECDYVNYVGSGIGTYDTYAYRDSVGKVEARYAKKTLESGYSGGTSVYDDTEKEIFYDGMFSDVSQFQSLAEYFKASGYPADVPLVLPVDAAGHDIDIDNYTLEPTVEEGRKVYVFYGLSNPLSDGNMLRCWPEGSNRSEKATEGTYIPPYYRLEFQRYVLDAVTNRIVRIDHFADKVAPENLLMTRVDDTQYSNKSADEALSIMKTAGFDQKNALNVLSGHD